MFQPWRLKVREAEEALKRGRIEEASRLLAEQGLMEFLPAQRLMARVAEQMTQRAERQFAVGSSRAGWRDLESAVQLGADEADISRVKRQYHEQGLREAEAYLQAGDPAAAVARLAALRQRGADGQEYRLAQDAAAKALAAQKLCHAGLFAAADEELRAALALRPQWNALKIIRDACIDRASSLRTLVEKLHAAVAAEEWTIVLSHAEAILELCPEHAAALEARRRAWRAVGTDLPAEVTSPAAGRPIARPRRCPNVNAQPTPDANEPAQAAAAPRFLLWVDGVGGYLVCRGDVVTLGQPVQGSYVDVPILGDISRLHALVRREGESYLIEPLRPTRVDGLLIEGPTLLADNRSIELGDGVILKFRLPNPLSRTARLDFVSRHRTQPTTDGVLLMAESCILGPHSTSHVTCRKWSQQVVLFPQGEALNCRTTGRFSIDGVEYDGRGPLGYASQIVGDDFSLSLEKV